MRSGDPELSGSDALPGGDLIELHAGLHELRSGRRHTQTDATTGKQPQRAAPTAAMRADAAPEGSDADLVVSAAARARAFMRSAELTNVGPAELEQLADDVRRLATAYQQHPLDGLLGDMASTQQRAFELLDGRQRPAQTLDLSMLACIASALMARASHDLGEPREAMTQARAAYVCADNAGHSGLRAWARGLQALIAYWAGDLEESVRYGQHGVRAVGVRPASSAVWAASGLARSLAALGRAEESRSAIDEATRLRDLVEPDELDGFGGLCSFSRPRQLYYAADALSWGGRHEAADTERFARDAIDSYEQGPAALRAFGDEAGARCALAIAHIESGSVDGAVDVMDEVTCLPPAQRTHGVRAAVSHVQRALARSPIRAGIAADLADAMQTFQAKRLTLPR